MQRHLGCSPMRYYSRLRLAAARNALFYSDLPIQDIAADCGFSSLSPFARSFHERYGQSPREYRRNISARNCAGLLRNSTTASAANAAQCRNNDIEELGLLSSNGLNGGA